jgi:hypothetical protein
MTQMRAPKSKPTPFFIMRARPDWRSNLARVAKSHKQSAARFVRDAVAERIARLRAESATPG